MIDRYRHFDSSLFFYGPEVNNALDLETLTFMLYSSYFLSLKKA